MAGNSSDSDLVLVKKKNVTSIVWDYFRLKVTAYGRVADSEASHPVCLSCKKSVPAKGGNTTNQLVHLRDWHPDLYYQVYSKIPSGYTSTRAATTGNSTADHSSNYSSLLSQPLLITLLSRRVIRRGWDRREKYHDYHDNHDNNFDGNQFGDKTVSLIPSV